MKRRLPLAVYLTIGALLLGAWAALPDPLAYGAKDERSIREAHRRAREVAAATFPDWRPEESPVLLTKGAVNYLVEPDLTYTRLAPPPVPLVANGVAPVKGRNVVILAGKAELEQAMGGLAGEMDVAGGSGETALIKGLLRTNSRRLTDEEYMGVVLHEMFHLYQMPVMEAWLKRMPQQPGQSELWTTVYTDAENNRLQNEEGAALLAAVRAPDRDAAMREAGRFLAARERRRAYWAGKVGPTRAGTLLEWEQVYEWVEGLARYIQIRADADQHLTDQIGEPVDATFARERVYRLGAGQALLLDRLAPGWQQRVGAGAALTETLAAAVGQP